MPLKFCSSFLLACKGGMFAATKSYVRLENKFHQKGVKGLGQGLGQAPQWGEEADDEGEGRGK